MRCANKLPYNVERRFSDPFPMNYGSNSIHVLAGGNYFSTPPGADLAAIFMDGESVLGFRLEDGQCLVSMTIRDQKNQILLQVQDNELVFSSENWDVEWIANTLTVRRGLRDIAVKVRFNVPDGIEVITADFYENGLHVGVEADGIWSENSGRAFSQQWAVSESPIGVTIGVPHYGGSMHLMTDKRLFGWNPVAAVAGTILRDHYGD